MPAPKGNKNAVGNKGGGAPSKYQAKYAKLAALACQAGCTDQEVADLIGVSQKTINRWKLQHVEFVTALKSGKAPADERVVQSLYQRALGYDPQWQALSARRHRLHFLAEEPAAQ